ncbi:hypothetical protein Pcinc_042151 [Petrolisthes cinctipes]|uniref:Secreted protein n=1 Tax=Petrolisthes cinctipes TaxID=88211 RepID=A0AAE1BIV0_PETCI|nr:hypothetical protein Pcinc_042151 [Petrolisthes cinctipes]
MLCLVLISALSSPVICLHASLLPCPCPCIPSLSPLPSFTPAMPHTAFASPLLALPTTLHQSMLRLILFPVIPAQFPPRLPHPCRTTVLSCLILYLHHVSDIPALIHGRLHLWFTHSLLHFALHVSSVPHLEPAYLLRDSLPG